MINEAQEKWLYSPEGIDDNINKLYLQNETLRFFIAETISKLPRKVIDWAIKKLIFISTPNGMLINYKDLPKGKHLIILSETLTSTAPKDLTFTIAHEIAHAYLNHRNHYDEEGLLKQEKEADELSLKWLGEDYVEEYAKSSKGH